MVKNMASADRIIRVLIAVIFSVLYFGKIVPATLGLILFAVGIVFLLTSFLGFCPIYRIFGLSTKKKSA